jgi:hypothetical protein
MATLHEDVDIMFADGLDGVGSSMRSGNTSVAAARCLKLSTDPA